MLFLLPCAFFVADGFFFVDYVFRITYWVVVRLLIVLFLRSLIFFCKFCSLQYCTVCCCRFYDGDISPDGQVFVVSTCFFAAPWLVGTLASSCSSCSAFLSLFLFFFAIFLLFCPFFVFGLFCNDDEFACF